MIPATAAVGVRHRLGRDRQCGHDQGTRRWAQVERRKSVLFPHSVAGWGSGAPHRSATDGSGAGTDATAGETRSRPRGSDTCPTQPESNPRTQASPRRLASSSDGLNRSAAERFRLTLRR